MNTQKRTNPLDRYGNRTKCTICGSVFHWVKKFKICPPSFHKQSYSEPKTLQSEVLQVIENNDKDQQRKDEIKSHQQFGQTTAEKLQKLLVNAGVRDSAQMEMLR